MTVTFPVERKQLFADFATFVKAHVESRDIDPMYPVLKALYSMVPRMDKESQLWHTLLYVAYYNIASAEMAMQVLNSPSGMHRWHIDDPVFSLPTNIERRGLRGGRAMFEHLQSLVDHIRVYGSIEAWLTHDFAKDTKDEVVPPAYRRSVNWARLNATLQSVFQNGRWAAYKTAEILMTVHGFPVEATDTGMAFSSGPRKGLMLFWPTLPKGNDKRSVEECEGYASQLRHWLSYEHHIKIGIEQLETCLCDFHALTEGRYYVGHDIDQMQLDIAKRELLTYQQFTGAQDLLAPIFNRLWEARIWALPKQYLGECNGRNGVDTARNKHYLLHHEVIVR